MGQSSKLDETEIGQWKIASEAAEKFTTLYYCAFDKPNRPDLPGFFMNNVVLIWNGNRFETHPSVVEFFTKLPRSTTHLHSLSAQPVHSKLLLSTKLTTL
ncbi:NTF2 export protein 2 [Fasciolopsis buskii]|uniref:NTF2 export protein 2 n=1 Tax=Fasciolopsis buskii TaxID=27845 RepID=A0A8E0RLQ4_9TREM|nr:NTF2 export protein 2 [Fasciolopsis buski]